MADLVPGSVFSNEKSPSLSNHSRSYQNHPLPCFPLIELSWSDLRQGLPKNRLAPIPLFWTGCLVTIFIIEDNHTGWFNVAEYNPQRIICLLQNTASWFGVLPPLTTPLIFYWWNFDEEQQQQSIYPKQGLQKHCLCLCHLAKNQGAPQIPNDTNRWGKRGS